MMTLIDSHVHLDFPEFDADRDAMMARARQAGVGLFINIGTDVPRTEKSLALALQYPDVYATAGLHPHDAKEANPEILKKLEAFLSHPRMVAIGEVGLDFFRNESTAAQQTDVFREFVRMQKRTGKPLVIHCRDAYDEMLRILGEEGPPPFRGVMHCFSSDKAMMKRFLDLGFYISFTGALTYKKNDALREACAECPLERILFETDAPFLPPQSHRGQRNESAYMIETAELAASLHGVTLETAAAQTTANAQSLFGLSSYANDHGA